MFSKKDLVSLFAVVGVLLSGCGKSAPQQKTRPLKKVIIERQVIDSYEIKACVLMPKPNETKEEYHKRRQRILEERAKDAAFLKKQIERIRKEEKDFFIRESIIQHKKEEIRCLSVSHCLDYYTPEAKKRLKDGGFLQQGNVNPSLNGKSTAPKSLPQGHYDGRMVNSLDDF